MYRKFILHTLNITDKVLRYTMENKVNLFSTKTDHRGKIEAQNKTSEELIKIVHVFIQKLYLPSTTGVPK